MFNECFFCGDSFGYDAVEKNYLHKVGKHLVCHNCLAELKGALKSDDTTENKSDLGVKSSVRDILAVLGS
jgi:hypothetical protein